MYSFFLFWKLAPLVFALFSFSRVETIKSYQLTLNKGHRFLSTITGSISMVSCKS